MSAKVRLIPYPEERALEHVTFTLGLLPTRIFALLLPVWCVEVKATVTDGEPYELIDLYLERGIAEAGLDNVVDLAAFFGLDEALVERALRFLGAIGHLSISGGRVALTDLGHRSVRDRVRYVVTRQDRRKMYFDAFGSRPLTRPYYDGRTVTLLSGDELHEVANRKDGPRFQMLAITHGFRREALAELANSDERDRYNLPHRIDTPTSLGEEPVYLPLYVVRAAHRHEQGTRIRYLAYTQASDEEDPDMTRLCEQTPDITSVLENEERLSQGGLDQTRTQEWLVRRGLDGHRPVLTREGMWQVTFHRSVFDADGQLPISKLGSFVILGNDFFQVWCADQGTRRRALLARIDSYLSARTRINPESVNERIRRIAHQLELGTMDIQALGKSAAKAGKRDLAAQLGSLAKANGQEAAW